MELNLRTSLVSPKVNGLLAGISTLLFSVFGCNNDKANLNARRQNLADASAKNNAGEPEVEIDPNAGSLPSANPGPLESLEALVVSTLTPAPTPSPSMSLSPTSSNEAKSQNIQLTTTTVAQDFIVVVENGNENTLYNKEIKAGLELLAKEAIKIANIKIFVMTRTSGPQDISLSIPSSSPAPLALVQPSPEITVPLGRGLSFAIAASCPATTTVNGKLCDQTVDYDRSARQLAAGKFADKLRAKAPRTYILITPREIDDLDLADAQTALNAIKKDHKLALVVLTTLVDSANCETEEPHTILETLAKDNGGIKLHSICATDWSKAVEDIKSTLVKSTQLVYPLPTDIMKLDAVAIDAKALDSKSYTVADGKITLVESAIPAGAKNFVITYQAIQNTGK